MAQRFGTYLIECGLVATEHVLDALDQQQHRKPPIGRIAMLRGFLKVNQVFEVLNAQLDSKLRFGAQAVALGFLTEWEVVEILAIQREEMPHLGLVLVESGRLDMETLQRALASFFEKMGMDDDDDDGRMPSELTTLRRIG